MWRREWCLRMRVRRNEGGTSVSFESATSVEGFSHIVNND